MEETWWTKPEQLDGEQRKVLALSPDGNHMVVGPPGSGKTNLLLLRATYLYRSGRKNISIITLGRVLREFLSTGSNNYPFSSDKMQTYIRWGTSLLADNGIEIDAKDNFEDVRTALLPALKNLADKKKAQNVYDCLLIDEAQDFTQEELATICCFAKQVFIVGDSNQMIMVKSQALDWLKEKCGEPIRLSAHYRNGLKICRVADGIKNLLDCEEGLEATSNYDESKFKSSVAVFGNKTIPEQVDLAVTELSTQLRAYPKGFMGILCPRHKELKEVWGYLSASPLKDAVQLQDFESGYTSLSGEQRVIVTTLHGAKGLEFRALHLLGMDTIKKFPLQKNMAYTAVTRAKTSLAIYHEGSLPGYLEKGLSALETVGKSLPSLEDLFRS